MKCVLCDCSIVLLAPSHPPPPCPQVQERALASEKGYPSPVYDAIEDTHANFKACTLKLLDDVEAHGTTEVGSGDIVQGTPRSCSQYVWHQCAS
jgi:hypothetical protein